MADNIVITAELKDLISGHLKDITNQVDKLDNSLSKMGKKGGASGSMLGSIFGGNLLAQGVSRATSEMKDFAKETLDSLVNYEYFSTSLKTMLKGDAMQGKALENQLITLAKTTPFSLVEVQQGTKQLMAYGFAAGSIVKNMKMLGDVSAGVGKPLGEVAYLYGTLKTQGRAFSKDINQFTSAGIPIVKELAKQFKVTDDKVMQLVSDGKVGFAEVEKAFESMTSKGSIFFNLMADQSKTVGGKISALGDSWEQLKVNIGKSQRDIMSGTIGFFDEIVSTISNFKSNENFLDEATKGMSRGGNWFNRALDKTGYDTRANNENLGYAGMLQKKLQDKTGNSKDVSETASFISGELKYLQRQKNDFDKRAVKDAEKDKNFLLDLQDKRDMLIYANKQLQGSARLLGSKEAPEKTTKKESEASSLEKGVIDKPSKKESEASSLEKVAKANRPTQINVNIENLVREINNTYQNVAKGMELTGEQIAKVLIGAVNDVSVTNFGN